VVMIEAVRGWWRQSERWYLAVGLANLVLGTSSVLIPLSIDRVFGRPVTAVGYLASLVSLVGVLGSLIWGRLSDVSHRRKPFMVWGYAAVGLCFLFVVFARTFQQLAILNMFLNFFWVANASVTVLLVIENSEEGTWEGKISRLNQIGAMGWVLGLGVGSVWMQGITRVVGEVAAIRALYVLVGVLGIMASAMAYSMVPRTMPRFRGRAFRGVFLGLGSFITDRARFAPLHLYYRLRPRRIIALMTRSDGFRMGTKRFFLSTLLSFVGMGIFGIPLSMLLSREFGFSSSNVFSMFLLQHVGIVLAYPLASRRIRRRGNRYVQMASLWVRCVLFAGFGVYLAMFDQSPGMGLLVAGFVLYGISWSFFQLSGVSLVSRLAREENRGLALGLYSAIAGVGWILAGLAGGLMAEYAGYGVAFIVSGVFLLLSLVVLGFVPDPARAAPDRRRSISEGPHPKTPSHVRVVDRSVQAPGYRARTFFSEG
jgi:MFS family permease